MTYLVASFGYGEWAHRFETELVFDVKSGGRSPEIQAAMWRTQNRIPGYQVESRAIPGEIMSLLELRLKWATMSLEAR